MVNQTVLYENDGDEITDEEIAELPFQLTEMMVENENITTEIFYD
jgi:hypothetical protein